MRIIKLGNVNIECSPLVLVLLALGMCFELFETILLAMLALSLHEACHTIIAYKLGVNVLCVEVQPFGFVARLETNISRDDELSIALAGPLFSLVCGCACIVISQYVLPNNKALSTFALTNIALGVINLLPALPLDGGRILRAMLEGFMSPQTALHICAGAGIVVSGCLCVVGVYVLIKISLNVTILVMGVFMLVGAIRELRLSGSAKVREILRRNKTLRRGSALRVRQLVLHKNVCAKSALSMLHSNCYNVIIVVDDNTRVLGDLDESTLMLSIAKYGVDITIGSII